MADARDYRSTSPNFAHDPTPTAEVLRQEAVHEPLIRAVRELVEAAMVVGPDADLLTGARNEVEAVVARLRARQLPGAYGIRYNDEAHSWSWGNAVIGQRNALATPLVTHHDDDGTHWAETELGPRHVGDEPGFAHSGVAGLLLDHLMGETASGFAKVTMTGTLTITPLRPVPLGRVRLEARMTRDEGRKVYVEAHLIDVPASGHSTDEGPCVEATGLFIVPRWAV